MKKIKEKTHVITVKVSKEELDRMDKYSKKMKLKRSQLVRNLVETGLDDLKLMNSTGLLHMAVRGYDFFEAFRKALENKSFEVENEKLIIEL